MTMTDHEPIATRAVDAKLREIWGKLEKPWIRRTIRDCLPPTRVRWLDTDFVVHPRDNFTEFRMWELGRPPEHEATEAIAQMLKGSSAVIVDVGANAGAFGLPLLTGAGAKARAVMFEPNPVMLARLEANIALNKFRNVRVFDCAVGDAEGRSPMFFPKNGNLGQGRVLESYGNVSDEGETIEVKIRPLADCLRSARVSRVDFLKVDVEGLEDKVICPLLEDDKAPKPERIYFEVEHKGKWGLPLLQMLEEHGYSEEAAYGANRLFRREAGHGVAAQ